MLSHKNRILSRSTSKLILHVKTGLKFGLYLLIGVSFFITLATILVVFLILQVNNKTDVYHDMTGSLNGIVKKLAFTLHFNIPFEITLDDTDIEVIIDENSDSSSTTELYIKSAKTGVYEYIATFKNDTENVEYRAYKSMGYILVTQNSKYPQRKSIMKLWKIMRYGKHTLLYESGNFNLTFTDINGKSNMLILNRNKTNDLVLILDKDGNTLNSIPWSALEKTDCQSKSSHYLKLYDFEKKQNVPLNDIWFICSNGPYATGLISYNFDDSKINVYSYPLGNSFLLNRDNLMVLKSPVQMKFTIEDSREYELGDRLRSLTLLDLTTGEEVTIAEDNDDPSYNFEWLGPATFQYLDQDTLQFKIIRVTRTEQGIKLTEVKS